MADPLVALLSDLVAIDSVNPALVPGGAGESAIADRIAVELRSCGLDVSLQDAAPGRPNVVGVFDTGVDGPSLMFCGHTDTVGVEGMSAPFSPDIRDGRLYGRGAQDMKAGLAAMIDAVRLVREGGPVCGRLVIAAVADEEFASIGADALVTEWTADAAVVTEPTVSRVSIGCLTTVVVPGTAVSRGRRVMMVPVGPRSMVVSTGSVVISRVMTVCA